MLLEFLKSIKINMTVVLLNLLISFVLLIQVNGHGTLNKPKARNVVYGVGPKFPSSNDIGSGGDIQNLNGK